MGEQKEKSFAAGVNRRMIETSARELGILLEAHIEIVLKATHGIVERLRFLAV